MDFAKRDDTRTEYLSLYAWQSLIGKRNALTDALEVGDIHVYIIGNKAWDRLDSIRNGLHLPRETGDAKWSLADSIITLKKKYVWGIIIYAGTAESRHRTCFD